jgi:hypothetical protein
MAGLIAGAESYSAAEPHTPRLWNVAMPDSSMPTIPVITIRPETNTERPDVAAATCSALARSRPAARSWRSRNR